VTATTPDVTTDLEILEALDFEPEHDCESRAHGKAPWHSGPAKYLLRVSYQCACGHARTCHIQMCAPAWDHAGRTGLTCGKGCGRQHERDNVWTIVAVF
jgi:hypothetical protein